MKITTIATLAILMASTISGFVNAQEGSRRDRGGGEGFDVASFVGRMDVNNNGILDQSEMSDRTKRFVERLGIDVNQPIALSEVLKRVENNGFGTLNNSSAAPAVNTAASKNSGFVRKVPGFGIPATAVPTVPTFGASSAGGANKSLEQFSESVRSQVESTLRRYDKNQNGILEPDESKDARWGNPTPQESDTNRDGNLSSVELAIRYAQREQAVVTVANPLNAAPQNSGGSQRGEGGKGGRSDASVQGGATTTTEPSSGATFATGNDKYRKYAEGLVENYDKNKDGKLDKDEFGQVRRAPSGADMNGDGFVTAGELADALGKGNPPVSSAAKVANSAESAAPSAPGSNRRNRDNTPATPTNEVRSGEPFSFNSSDKNGDGQIQMWEFETKWTDEKLQAFRKLDANGDGVISAEEAGKR